MNFYCCHTKSEDNKDNVSVVKSDDWINKRKGFYLEARSDKWRTENIYNYLSIITVLTNNTPDTIRYATYSCSWDMNYETSNKNFPLYGVECNRNFPEIITILPYSNDDEKKLEIRTKKSIVQVKGVKLTIGFNYVPVKFGEDVDDKAKLLFKHNNLIWSDSLIVP